MDFLKIYMRFFLSKINFSKGFIFNFSNRWQAFIKCFKNSPLENPELLLLWKFFSLISNRVMVVFHCQRRSCSTNRWVFFNPLSNQLSPSSAGPGSGLCCGPSSWVQLIFWLQMGSAGWSQCRDSNMMALLRSWVLEGAFHHFLNKTKTFDPVGSLKQVIMRQRVTVKIPCTT